MSIPARLPLYYTFGNHMHWADMEWLWGYQVLPGSVRDMLSFCEAAAVKSNVNVDGIGYEKLATEAPAALAAPREGVAVSAFYRESEGAGAQIDRYAGAGMGYPYVLRLEGPQLHRAC